MISLTTEERLALLLSVLGQDAEKVALKSLNPTRAKFVSKLLDEYRLEPPNSDEVAYIVEDFNKYFAFAMRSLEPKVAEAKVGATTKTKTAAKAPSQRKESGAGSPGKTSTTVFEPVEETGDIVSDLNQLDAFQISTALKDDDPRTIAVILQHLDTTLSAAIVENLEEEKRGLAVVLLSQPSQMPDRVKNQIVKTTFRKANAVDCRKEEVNQSEVIASLMRSLPKGIRKDLIEKLSEANEELVNEIRSKLYLFDDILRLDDRDTQKVLGETETDVLIVALQRAEPELVEKILGNLSKRAKQTIEEEMQYKTGVSEDEIEEARGKLVEAVGALDEAGR